MKEKILLTLMITALVGCGSSGSNDDSTPPEDTSGQQTGTFIDSAVANIEYRTSTLSERARTNAEGEFRYNEGDEVTFSVGGIDLPPAPARSLVTPLDLAGTSDINDTTALNIARMLQTLDDDGNPDNGINILDKAHEEAAGISPELVDFTSGTFGDDESLVNLFANSGSSTTTLVSTEQAKAHLSESLASLSGPFSTEMLAGNSFYNVYADEADVHNWLTDTFIFDESGSGVTVNGKEGTYSVDQNGVLLVTLPDDTFYINVIGKADEGHRKVCWAGELANINQCQSLSVEHFFNFESAAQQFATLQNQGTINLEGTWRVTETYDVCGKNLIAHYQTSIFELVSSGLSFTHDYVEDITLDPCSVITNTTATESGVDEAFQGANNLNITSAELDALFNDDPAPGTAFHGIVFYNNDTFDIFEEFTAGSGVVVVHQIWTRQP